jgi:hypothetical protein
MSDPTKELISQNEVVAGMVAGGWKRINSGYIEANSEHNRRELWVKECELRAL